MAAFPLIQPFLRRATRFLFPIECVVCGASLTDDLIPHFCSGCWSTLRPMPAARCARCDRPFVSPVATTHSPGHLCYACIDRPPSYTRAWTLYPYTPPLQNAIRLLKYQGKVSLVTPLANLMLTTLPRLDPIDLIIPVPLHHERLCQREFNQALLLADRIGRHLNISLSYTNLVRTTSTPPQTSLSRKSRLTNLRHAFVIRHPVQVMNKRILLIDDVFTTGTTVNECAKTLRRSGSADVFALTLARTIDQNLIPDHAQSSTPSPFPSQ